MTDRTQASPKAPTLRGDLAKIWRGAVRSRKRLDSVSREDGGPTPVLVVVIMGLLGVLAAVALSHYPTWVPFAAQLTNSVLEGLLITAVVIPPILLAFADLAARYSWKSRSYLRFFANALSIIVALAIVLAVVHG